jgi:hypothetical protein
MRNGGVDAEYRSRDRGGVVSHALNESGICFPTATFRPHHTSARTNSSGGVAFPKRPLTNGSRPVYGRVMGLVMADVSIGHARVSAAAEVFYFQSHALAWILASAAMLLALMAPALWNGFPLIFPDTGGYLDPPISGTLSMGRSALYGLFLYAGVPFSFWPNAVLQSALTVWLIVLTTRTHGLGGRPWLALSIVAMLTVCTSLPWFSGQLMPDILFPAAVLALYLLSFRNGRLARWESCLLAVVIVFAIPSHMAAAGMCVIVIAALWLLAQFKPLALPKPRLWFAAGSVAAGIALCPISNLAITGNFAFTPGGSSFLFGRLIEDGIIARYLDEHCPDASLRLCDFKATLPEDADDWLWDGNSPFRKLGSRKGFSSEERAITWATLERYPLMHVSTAVVAAITQFFAFQTEVDVQDNAPTVHMFADHFSQLSAQFMRARQQAEHFDVALLNYLHVPVAAVAVAGIGLALVFRRRLKIAPEAAALCLVILLALAANAAICGIFSHPVDRYQSRVVLLAPLAMALLFAQWRRANHTVLGPSAI